MLQITFLGKHQQIEGRNPACKGTVEEFGKRHDKVDLPSSHDFCCNLLTNDPFSKSLNDLAVNVLLPLPDIFCNSLELTPKVKKEVDIILKISFKRIIVNEQIKY